MKKIIQARWIIAAAWIAATVIFMLTAPDMAELTREKGQISVPDGYSSSDARKLIDDMSDSDAPSSSAVIVFHEKGLMTDKKDRLQKAVSTLSEHKEALHIKTVTSYFGEKNDDIKKQLLSKDKQTMLVQLQLDTSKNNIIAIKNKIDKELKPYGVSYGITGQSLIDEDVLKSSQDGLKKTEYITVAYPDRADPCIPVSGRAVCAAIISINLLFSQPIHCRFFSRSAGFSAFNLYSDFYGCDYVRNRHRLLHSASQPV